MSDLDALPFSTCTEHLILILPRDCHYEVSTHAMDGHSISMRTSVMSDLREKAKLSLLFCLPSLYAEHERSFD